MRRQDRVPAAQRRRQAGDPGQAQRAEEARGQGGGDGGHQPAPARRRQHEEDGLERGARGRGPEVGGPVYLRS